MISRLRALNKNLVQTKKKKGQLDLIVLSLKINPLLNCFHTTLAYNKATIKKHSNIRDLVTPEESLSFQGFVWNIEEPEVIIAALKDHTHGVCRKPCSLERETYTRLQG